MESGEYPMKNGEWIVIDGREYQLDAVLSTGAGSYGQVWAATDDEGRAVALKFINTEAMSQADPGLRGHWRAHLEREIAFLAGLDPEQSRHIVTLLDHGQMDGQPVLVLERLAANLGQWLAQQRRDNAPPPDLERILDWAGQILTGLEVIHNAGFVYRDLKFSNILVDERGERLKLADFGSLKRENGDSTRSFIGTPATMAPEQALPVRSGPEGSEYVVDYRADYYALGLLLFSLFTRQPATAAQRRLGQLLAQHGQEGAARHGEQLGGLNDEERELLRQSIEFWTVPVITLPGSGAAAQLTGLSERLLARDPAERPQNSAEIRTVLQAVRLGQAEPLTLAPTSDTPAMVADWDLPPPPTLPPNRYRRRAGTANRSPWPRRAAALAGVMGLAGTLAWAIVIRPTSEFLQNRPIAPDAVITTAPAVVEPAPVASMDTPSPAPESPAALEEPVADSKNEPAIEPETEPVVASESPPDSNPAAVEIAEPPVAPPVARPVAKPEPKAPIAPPFVARPVAKPEPKAPVAPEPAITRNPPRTVKAAPAPLRNKPAPPVRTERTVKTTPLSPPATTRPATVAPVSPVARAEPRLQPTPPTLPPIRLESRPQPKPTPPTLPPIRLESRPQPAPPTLPPINLVSRADPPPATTPVRQAQPTNAPKPTARTAPTRNPPAPPKKPAPRPTDPVTQFQEDATRASAGVRRDVEALTNWMGRTGASVGTEIQRGLEDANQTVTRWTRSSRNKVERRDRWSEQHGDKTRRQYDPPSSYDEAEEFAVPPRPQYYR
jgi:serine/threonine protein kinase